MDSNTARRLLDLNRQFYQTFGREFASTRRRLQPGVRRILESLGGDENILDLGCGNGELAKELARRGHPGSYTGLDFSPALLGEIEGLPANFEFTEADITGEWEKRINAPARRFDLVLAFAVLHHIPGLDLRLGILHKIRSQLRPGGRFIHSEWKFLGSDKLRARIQPWEAAGFSPGEMDPGDTLIDWRHGGRGLRYVHAFDENELEALAEASGFVILESFRSDGQGGKLGLYQDWRIKLNQVR
jgi:SAM-dependent methyltransferase